MDAIDLKRTELRAAFWDRLFLLGGFPGATDTYKRTMWSAVPEAALADCSYHLTFRKALPEPGCDGQLVMAGHEAMLAQWFHRPLQRADIELARQWYGERSAVKAFPHELWDAILAQSPGDEVTLPVDVWGFPGGQSFRAGVPCLSFEGMGGAVSYLEPAMCRYFAPVIQATKARLMQAATPRDAEFGLRAAVDDTCHIVMLLARYVGGRGRLTSNDLAEFLYPELFQSIGTIGHEMMSSGQSFDRSLAEAEYDMMSRFVSRMGSAALLCDLVDAESVGLENVMRVLRENPDNTRVGVRVDSGDIAQQCILYHRRMRDAGIGGRTIVFEDEVTPELVKLVYSTFRLATGEEPALLFPGAGGYWWKLVHRDTVSAAFKRSATGDHPNIKFSNSPGKESIPGTARVYGDGDTLVIADRSEPAAGEPLFVKLVERGRIVYDESYDAQADRAARTWGQYRRTRLSDGVTATMERFRAMRTAEVAAAKVRLAATPPGR